MNKNDTGNPYNRKVIYINGKNLKKIKKDVFFGDINGLILNKNQNEIDQENKEVESLLSSGESDYIQTNEMFILPPDFMKYRDVVSEKELENIEIKFLVKDTQIVKNPKIKDITEKIDIENDKEGKIEIILEEKLDKDKYKNKSLKAKVEFKLLAVGILDGQVNVNITISNDEDFSKSIIFNNEKKTIQLDF